MKIVNKLVLILLVLMAMILTTCQDVPQCLIPSQSIDLPNNTIFDCNQLLSRYQQEDNSPSELPPVVNESYTLSLQNNEFNGGVFAKDPNAFKIASTNIPNQTHSFSGLITISAKGNVLYTETLNIASLTASNNTITFGLTNPDSESLASYATLSNTDAITVIITNGEISGNTIGAVGVNGNKSFNIYDEYDLQGIKYDLDGAYIVKNDISMTNAWEPIGTNLNPFVGSLKGEGNPTSGGIPKTISGIQMNITGASDGAGLFGVINSTANPTIFNIILTVANSPTAIKSSSAKVGVLAGSVKQAVVDFLIIDGAGLNTTVEGVGDVGGVVGYIEATGNVTIRALVRKNLIIKSTGDNAGGLVGRIDGTGDITIKGTSVATIIGTTKIGGMIGALLGSGGTSVIGAYSKQSARSSGTGAPGGIQSSVVAPIIGGLIGFIDRDATVGFDIIRGYNQANITASGAESASQIGGIFGSIGSNTHFNFYGYFAGSINIHNANFGYLGGNNFSNRIVAVGHYKPIPLVTSIFFATAHAVNTAGFTNTANSTALSALSSSGSSYSSVFTSSTSSEFTFGTGADDWKAQVGYFPTFYSPFPYGEAGQMQGLVGGAVDGYDVDIITNAANPNGYFLPKMLSGVKVATLQRTVAASPSVTIRLFDNISAINNDGSAIYTNTVDTSDAAYTWVGNKVEIPLFAGVAHSSAYDNILNDQEIILKFTIGTKIIYKSIRKKFEIYDYTDLAAMKFDLDGQYLLKNNIVLQATDTWTSLSGFTGWLKGDGGVKTISNFAMHDAGNGFFNDYAQANMSAPGIENIKFIMAEHFGAANNNVGLVIGTLTKGHLKNISIDGTPGPHTFSIKGKNNIGGMIGRINASGDGDVKIESSTIEKLEVTGAGTVGGDVGHIGGAIGYINGGRQVDIHIDVSEVEVNYTFTGGGVASRPTGGTVGKFENSSRTATLKSYNNKVTVNNQGDKTGGIAGRLEKVSLIGGVTSSAITGSSEVGGLVGSGNYSTIKGYFKDSNGDAEVTGTGNQVGGLVGYAIFTSVTGYTTSNRASVDAIVISGVSSIGGLVGDLESGSGSSSQASAYGYVNLTSDDRFAGSVNGVMRIEGTGDRIGGLVGRAKGSVIGHVSGAGPYGGASNKQIKITGVNNVGGLVGEMTSGSSSSIKGRVSIAYMSMKTGGGILGNANSGPINIVGYVREASVSNPGGGTSAVVGGMVKETNNFAELNGYVLNMTASSFGGADKLGLIAATYSDTTVTTQPLNIFAYNLVGRVADLKPLAYLTADNSTINSFFRVCEYSYPSNTTFRVNGLNTTTDCNSPTDRFEYDLEFDTSNSGNWAAPSANTPPILKDSAIDLDGDGVEENYFGGQ